MALVQYLRGKELCIVTFLLFLEAFDLRKALKKFHSLRQTGLSENEAASQCWKSYHGFHLVEYKKWQPTKGNPGARRGPAPPPFKMTQKTGPSPKLSNEEVSYAKQILKRHPKLSNKSIAHRIDTRRTTPPKKRKRAPQRTPSAKRICRRKLSVTPKDVSRAFCLGVNRTSENGSENYRGYRVIRVYRFVYPFCLFL